MTKLKKKKKATPPQEKEALTEESQKAKEGEKEVLAPPQLSFPFLF